MPKAGITVESCIIGKWKKAVGDHVAMGEILFDYETDKASFECESTAEGELLEIFFADGDEVPCLVNVCAIGAKGEDCSALRPDGAAPAEAPAAQEAAPVPAAAPAAASAAPAVPGAPVSPRARKLAESAGVDPSQAAGTGPHGRVIERDVRQLMKDGVPAAAQAQVPAAVESTAPAAADTDYEDVKLPNIRKVIAKGMTTSLQTMAQLTEHFTFDATAIQSYRKMLKGMEGDYSGITLGDMLLFAVSRTILHYPDLNANTLDDSTVRRFKHVNLGVAVDTPRGLMVPTIFNADEKSLLEISKEVKTLAAEARSGKISPDLLAGGTFTVTNLGSTGVEMFTPIINPPQTGILGACGITQRVRAGKDGQIALYPAMGLSLTVDHRIVDGAPAANFMKTLCRNLEQFTALLAI